MAKTIYAAGTIPWRWVPVDDGSSQLMVLLIHRTKQRDVTFPKGKLDPGESMPQAAVRETLEETGLAVGWPSLDDRETSEIRRGLLGGVLLSDMLESRSERLALETLVPFARWCPNFNEARTFDTRFYAVAAPPHEHELTVEEAEHSHIFWASARETLMLADRGEIAIIFPTRRNLEKLAQQNDFLRFSDHAASFPVDLVTPWMEDRDGRTHLCIPGHLGYPVTSEPIDRVRRG